MNADPVTRLQALQPLIQKLIDVFLDQDFRDLAFHISQSGRRPIGPPGKFRDEGLLVIRFDVGALNVGRWPQTLVNELEDLSALTEALKNLQLSRAE